MSRDNDDEETVATNGENNIHDTVSRFSVNPAAEVNVEKSLSEFDDGGNTVNDPLDEREVPWFLDKDINDELVDDMTVNSRFYSEERDDIVKNAPPGDTRINDVIHHVHDVNMNDVIQWRQHLTRESRLPEDLDKQNVIPVVDKAKDYDVVLHVVLSNDETSEDTAVRHIEDNRAEQQFGKSLPDDSETLLNAEDYSKDQLLYPEGAFIDYDVTDEPEYDDDERQGITMTSHGTHGFIVDTESGLNDGDVTTEFDDEGDDDDDDDDDNQPRRLFLDLLAAQNTAETLKSNASNFAKESEPAAADVTSMWSNGSATAGSSDVTIDSVDDTAVRAEKCGDITYSGKRY